MKLFKLPVFSAVMLAVILWSCNAETVNPKDTASNDVPAIAGDFIAHPDPSPICSDRITFTLVEETTGSAQINNCGFFPCSGQEPNWGTVEVLNSDVALYQNVSMAFGWYVEKGETFLGDNSVMTIVNGIPQVQPAWATQDINPIVNKAQLITPVPSNLLNTCFDVASRITVVKLDFFSGADPNTRTDLWLKDDKSQALNNSANPFVMTWCFGSCGPVVTSITAGDCSGCNSENTVDFIDCDTVNVSSCKDLSNVVLVYTDCEWEKFDGLTTTSGSFSGTGTNAGKSISHVYVKSGCYKSGEGPGFGRRFDGPCVNGNCAPISNGNGGKNK